LLCSQCWVDIDWVDECRITPTYVGVCVYFMNCPPGTNACVTETSIYDVVNGSVFAMRRGCGIIPKTGSGCYYDPSIVGYRCSCYCEGSNCYTIRNIR
jgi:hypothetical protein